MNTKTVTAEEAGIALQKLCKAKDGLAPYSVFISEEWAHGYSVAITFGKGLSIGFSALYPDGRPRFFWGVSVFMS